MAIRIALFAVRPQQSSVFLLNGLNASVGVAVSAFGLLAVASGATLGYFADRLPELPAARRWHARRAGRLAGVHGDRR